MTDQSHHVTVYVQPGCAPCHQAVEFLTQHGVQFERKDIRADPQAFQEAIATGSKSTPTTVINGEVITGFDPQRFKQLLGL